MTDIRRWEWERALLADPAAAGMRLTVLLALATSWDQRTGRVRTTQSQLATWTGHDERRIRKMLQWAREAGYLEQTVRGHRAGNGRSVASEYVLALPQQGADAPEDPATQQGAQDPLDLAPQQGATRTSSGSSDRLNRALRTRPSVVTPSQTSSSGGPDAMYVDPSERPDDDEPEFPDIHDAVGRAGIPAQLWSDWHIQQTRDRIWNRLQPTADFRAALAWLIDHHVIDPLAYIANLNDTDLEQLTRYAKPQPTNGHRPPWCGQCDERTRYADYDTDAPRQCPICHPKSGALT